MRYIFLARIAGVVALLFVGRLLFGLTQREFAGSVLGALLFLTLLDIWVISEYAGKISATLDAMHFGRKPEDSEDAPAPEWSKNDSFSKYMGL